MKKALVFSMFLILSTSSFFVGCSQSSSSSTTTTTSTSSYQLAKKYLLLSQKEYNPNQYEYFTIEFNEKDNVVTLTWKKIDGEEHSFATSYTIKYEETGYFWSYNVHLNQKYAGDGTDAIDFSTGTFQWNSNLYGHYYYNCSFLSYQSYNVYTDENDETLGYISYSWASESYFDLN